MGSSDLLSLEQQFKIKLFESQVQHLSRDDMQELIMDLYENSLVQERLCENMMRECLGINHSSAA